MQLDTHPELIPFTEPEGWDTAVRNLDVDPDAIVNAPREPSIVSDYSDIMNGASSIGYSVYNIRQFCQGLRDSQKASNASISSIELHCETIGIPHRYLILQVQCNNKQNLYIRLDRRRDQKRSVIDFTLGFSAPEAPDGVSY